MERKIRSYRAKDTSYERAMRRAKKNKSKLALIVEDWIDLYGKGYWIQIHKPVKGISDPTTLEAMG